MRALSGLLSVAALTVGVPAQGLGAADGITERAAIEQFRRAWHGWADAEADAEVLAGGIAALAGRDSDRVARSLVAVHGKVREALDALDARRLELSRAMTETLDDEADDPKRGRGRASAGRRRELRGEWFGTRPRVDRLRRLAGMLRERVAESRSESAQRWLFEQVLVKRSQPVRLRLAVAESLAHTGFGVTALIRGQARVRDAAGLCAVLAGLRRAGPQAASAADATVRLLTHRSGAVREYAARALAAMAVPQAVEPMIALLERERGQARSRVATALTVLTGQPFGELAESWRAWLTDHREALERGDLVLGGGERVVVGAAKNARGGKGATRRSAYMGLPQDGAALVYVIDASLSMGAKVDFTVPGQTASRDATRWSASIGELIRALATLSADKSFDIIAFHEGIERFADRPVPASAKNIAAAQGWARGLEMSLMTNTHDALQEALALLGDRPRDRVVGDGVDTIYLLTDGRPVILDPTRTGGGRRRGRGRNDSADAILAALADWDPLGRVTIHCVGVGKGLARRFLQRIAAARGGVARFY